MTRFRMPGSRLCRAGFDPQDCDVVFRSSCSHCFGWFWFGCWHVEIPTPWACAWRTQQMHTDPVSPFPPDKGNPVIALAFLGADRIEQMPDNQCREFSHPGAAAGDGGHVVGQLQVWLAGIPLIANIHWAREWPLKILLLRGQLSAIFPNDASSNQSQQRRASIPANRGASQDRR